MQTIIGRVLLAGEGGGRFLSRVAGAGGARWARVAPSLVGAFLWLPLLAGVVFVAESGMAGTPTEEWVGAGVAWAGLPLMRGWTREGVPGLPHLFPHPVRGSRTRWVLWAGVTVAATGWAWVSAPPIHPGRALALLVAMALLRVWMIAKGGRIAPAVGRMAGGALTGAALMPNQVRPSLGMFKRGGLLIVGAFFLVALAGLFVVLESGGIFGWGGEGITTAVLAGLVLPVTLVKWQPERGPVARVAGAAQRAKVAARTGIPALREDRQVDRAATQGTEPAEAATWTPEDPRLAPWTVGMPALDSDPGDVIEWLVDTHHIPIRHEPVLFTGRVDTRRWGGSLAEWATAKPHMIAFGLPGHGKTSSLLGPNVMAFPGPAVVSSSKPDVAVATAAWRSTLGRCLFFDPSGQADKTPAHCQRIRWSPLVGIATHDDAIWTARQMVAASIQQGGSEGEAAAHFADRAAGILAPLLYAGVLAGGRISRVVEWVVVGPETTVTHEDGTTRRVWDEPLALLQDAGQDDLHRRMAAFADASAGHGGRENHSVLTTVERLLGPYATHRALAEADEPDFDPLSWLRTARGWPTIYVVTSAGSEAKAMGPLVALMMAQIIEVRRRTYSEADRPLPLLLAMDEIASAPVPGLSAFVSGDRGIGVQVLALSQTDEQVTENPLYGSSLLSGFGQKAIFAESGSHGLHVKVEEETARHRVWLANLGESEARAGMATAMRSVVGGITAVQGPSQSAGASQHTERVLDRADVAGALGRGQVRFLEGYRALTRSVEVVDEATGEVIERLVAPPVTLLPPVDKPGPWLALTRWAEATYALDAVEESTAEPLSA